MKRKDDDMGSDITRLSEKRSEAQDKPVQRTYRKRIPAPSMRLKQLECFEEVDRMVRAGEYSRTIASYIQEEAGEYLDATFDAVVRAIQRYRQSLDEVGVTTKINSDDVDEEDPFYELKMLEEKFQQQCKRIDMEVSTEQSLKKLFSTTHKEFEILNFMGGNILKLKKQLNLLSSDTGRRGKGKGHVGRLDIARIVESPESRHKVLSFVETMIENPDLMDDLLEAKDSIKLPEVDEQKEEEIGVVKKDKSKKTPKSGSRKNKIAKVKSRLKKKKQQ